MFCGPENTVYISLHVMLITVCSAVQLAPFLFCIV